MESCFGISRTDLEITEHQRIAAIVDAITRYNFKHTYRSTLQVRSVLNFCAW